MLLHNPIIRDCWAVFALVWLIGAIRTKPTARATSLRVRTAVFAAVVIGFLLVGSEWGPRLLAPPPLFVSHAVQFAGTALTALGCAFAIWARVALGRNWSGRPTLKAGHELVVGGPYALTRHPIYTGILVAILGTALADLQWRSILGFILVALALVVKIHQEERLMLEAFPDAYPPYRQRVKALIPGVF